ncbi:hypothetical protein HT031_006108 [Scenedesmus sp. PABB004]|nr:hypothetical protein HT031_006108 [Scenedesmus sp. PABB004]
MPRLVLLACLLLAGAVSRAAALGEGVAVSTASTQLSPSVNLIGKFDWEVDASGWSRCLDMVWRAAGAGSDRINFVPTHHWLPASGSAAASNTIGAFCHMHHTPSGANACSPWSDALIAEFRRAMAVCFTEAMRQGLTVYVRPHLDDGTANGAWRNGLLLRPEAKHAGFRRGAGAAGRLASSLRSMRPSPRRRCWAGSALPPSHARARPTSYADIMLAPLADALRDALAAAAGEGVLRTLPGRARPAPRTRRAAPPGRGTQGEMSATVMRFASEWGGLVEGLRARVGGAHADVLLGVGLNFNRLDDTTSVAKTYDSSRLSWLMWQLGAERSAGDVPPIDGDGVRRLLGEQLDFVGISAYAPYTGPGMALNEFESAAFMFADEMRSLLGIDVAALVASGRLELQYSEFGLGGGGAYSGTQARARAARRGRAHPRRWRAPCVARSPAEVALRPFFGIYGAYAPGSDPWALPANRAFLREFYFKAIAWLAAWRAAANRPAAPARASDPNSRTYRVSSCFIWSMASWDVLGVHPESSSDRGSYRDPVIADAVATYNRRVVAAQGGAAVGGGGGRGALPAAGK